MNKDELRTFSTIIFSNENDIKNDISYKKKLIEDTAQKIIREKIKGTLTEAREDILKKKIYAKLDSLDKDNYFKKDCFKVFKSVNFYKKIIYYDEDFIAERKLIFIESSNEALRRLVNLGLDGKDLMSFWNKFEQRFYFNMKDYLLKFMNEDNGYEESEYRIGLVQNLFDSIVERNNYEKNIRKKLKEKIGKITNINKNKLKQFLIEDLNGNELDTKKLEDIINKDLGMVNLDASLKTGEDTNFLDISKEDNLNNRIKKDVEEDLWQILEKSKMLLPSIKNKSLRTYLKALISVNIFQYELKYGYCLELHDYVDTDFEVFYKGREDKSMNFNKVMADYLNKKERTIRDYVKKIKEQRTDFEILKNLMDM